MTLEFALPLSLQLEKSKGLREQDSLMNLR